MTLTIYKKAHFPDQKTHFLLSAQSGLLEVSIHPSSITHAATTVICHPHPLMGGTMDNKVITTILKACSTLDVSAIRFNFRGVGKSEGTFDNGKGELEDLHTVMQWLKAVLPDTKITLVGFSFGSFIAACAEQHYDLEKLILIAPPVERFDFQSLPSFRCPWTVIQGEQDVTVNPPAVLQWLNSRSPLAQYYSLSTADHFFHGQLLALRDLIIQVLRTTC